VELSCLAASKEIRGVTLDVHPEWSILRRFAVSTSHAHALYQKAARADLVHNHSLWSMVNVAAGWVVPGRRAKLVTSPRGTLSPWALGRTKQLKQALWPLQRRALDRADLLHATSETEYHEIRAQGLTAPVTIIPNGIDLPWIPDCKPSAPQRTLLFLSRIHPKKNIGSLLQAWRRLQDAHPDWRLVIAGRGEPDHEREVRELATASALRRVEFPGPLYGPEKTQAYLGAELFVLPTHSENFGMVVAEALAHAVPAIVSRGAPWSGLDTEGCGWWIDGDVDVLAETLDSAMRLAPERLAEMGQKGRAWMQRDFSWESIAERMEEAYTWAIHGGSAPRGIRAK
jgi:glycosyltransferase involved in cell wall biosynthesis